MVFILSVLILVACAIFGKVILLVFGVKDFSMLGGGFVLGYGFFGLLLILSLKYFGNVFAGALVFLGIFFVLLSRLKYLKESFKFNLAANKISKYYFYKYDFFSEFAILMAVISLVFVVALVYLPMCGLAIDSEYNFPDIFDLPKHLFAIRSLYDAKYWPPPSPFFLNEAFAYNFLFYCPVALVAKLIGNPLAIFQVFPVFIISIAIALPVTILDIVRSITQSKLTQVTSVVLATWVGGLTPIFVQGKPSIGFSLYLEKLVTSQIWVDETFLSLIYVPQHVFAVLCGLISVCMIAPIRFEDDDYKRILLAGLVTVIGILSSLILLPHLVVSFGISIASTFVLQLRKLGFDLSLFYLPWSIIAALIPPLIIVIPFVIEALKWSGSAGSIVALPDISMQWLYVVTAIGIVLPLGMVGMLSAFHWKKAYGIGLLDNSKLVNLMILNFVGVIGLLFGGYPDAGIKSGLWVRIGMVPLASIGFLFLMNALAYKCIKNIYILVMGVGSIVIAIINYPTMMYFVDSAWRQTDPGIKNAVNYIRSLPLQSRLVLFSTEQNLVALSGRQIDFDFSPLRTDQYMPPEGRLRAKRFWDGLAQNDYEIWVELEQRYDYLIAPAGSISDARLATRFPVRKVIGGYSVYKIGAELGS